MQLYSPRKLHHDTFELDNVMSPDPVNYVAKYIIFAGLNRIVAQEPVIIAYNSQNSLNKLPSLQ